jgi:hypothetical protein
MATRIQLDNRATKPQDPLRRPNPQLTTTNNTPTFTQQKVGHPPIFAPDGTPRAIVLCSPKQGERDVALKLLARCRRNGHATLIGDKGYAGREFANKVDALDAAIIRPRRKNEPGKGLHLAPIRQRIESIFWTC